MRPVVHQAKKAVDAEAGVIEETQDPDESLETPGDHESQDGDNTIRLLDGNSEYEDDDEAPDNKRKAAKKPPKKGKATTQTQEAGQENKVSKPRKVAAQAHANFRKLKIKNKNSKAGGRGGRYGRR